MSLRKILIAGFAAAAVFAAPGTGSAQTTLTVGMPTTPPNIVHMPMFVANDLGFFKQEGLEIKLIAFEGGVKSYRAAVSGSIDVAVGAGAPAIVGRSRGAKTKLILSSAPKLEVTMVVQKGIKSIKDLKGKKIGIQQPGGFAHILSMMVMRSGGLKKKDVHFVSILSEDVPPLVAGQIDTAILHVEQEMVAKSKAPGLHALARLWEIAPKNLYSVMVAQESVIAKKRKAMLALVKGHIRAVRVMYTDKAKVLPLLVKHSGLSKDVVSKAYDILVKSCIWDAGHGLSKTRINFTTNLMEKVGNIKKGSKPAYNDSVDLSLANQALKELGPYNGPCK